MHSLLIPLLRILSDGKFHPGTHLAAQLSVSRATVCNVLKQAEPLGIHLHKVQGHGYQLPIAPNWLDAGQIQADLHGEARQIEMIVLNETRSTNTDLLNRHVTASPLVCLAAEYQTSGRGRRGKQWEATLGGSLTFSVRWISPLGIAALSGLSLAVGVAVRRALQRCGVEDARLKWPNDILWQDKKLAGILIEVQGESMGPAIVVIGIGINVQLPDDVRANIDQPVTDLHEITGHSIDRNHLLAEILNALYDILLEFAVNGLSRLRHEWSEWHAHNNQWLNITLADGKTINGIARGIQASGALLIELPDGQQLALHSGEVQRARRTDSVEVA